MVKFIYFSSICVLLTVLFMGLKNHSVIDWSWWIVFSPVIIFYVAIGSYIIYRGVKK